jgi:hypothetical protein
MPTTPDQEATMAHKLSTRRQLKYLKALAERTGQTFQWPHNAAAASREIKRLTTTRPSSKLERAIERFDDRQAIEAVQDAAAIADGETGATEMTESQTVRRSL